MFEDAGMSHKRSWMCFVCGKKHDNYEEYRDHILKEHEEGREYLKCPDCGAPVRDMKVHYKAKHPKRILPKGIQLKATVWRDFSPNGQKKKTRKPSPRTGYYTSKKNGGVDLYYRSGLEATFYELLEEDVDVLSYEPEPYKIPYFHNGKWHNYTPDLRINYIDGSTQIWEIKPTNQTEYARNQAKFVAAQKQTESVGWEFVVQTEEVLTKLRQKLFRQKKSNQT